MTWEPIAKQIGNKPVEQVSVSLRHRRITIFLPAGLCADLGWSAGDKIEVARGRGDDAGRVRLARSPSGFVLRSYAASTRLSVNFGAWPEIKDDTVRAVEVGHQLDAEAAASGAAALVVSMPLWARKGDAMFARGRAARPPGVQPAVPWSDPRGGSRPNPPPSKDD